MADDDAELDYDDPSFLASAAAAVPPPTTSDLSYAQRRRKQRLDSERKQVDHALRQQRTGRAAETERREEGLATSLIDLQVQQAATAGGAGEGNALKMMRFVAFVASLCLHTCRRLLMATMRREQNDGFHSRRVTGQAILRRQLHRRRRTSSDSFPDRTSLLCHSVR